MCVLIWVLVVFRWVWGFGFPGFEWVLGSFGVWVFMLWVLVLGLELWFSLFV